MSIYLDVQFCISLDNPITNKCLKLTFLNTLGFNNIELKQYFKIIKKSKIHNKKIINQ